MQGHIEVSNGLIRSVKGVLLPNIGYLLRQTSSAVVLPSHHGIKPPQPQWFLQFDELEMQADLVEVCLSVETSTWLANQLQSGLSFDWPGLGSFVKNNEAYLLLPEPGSKLAVFHQYALPTLQIQPVPTAKWNKSSLNEKLSQSVSKSNWYLKVAAVLLFMLGLNLLAINYLSDNGSFFRRDLASLNLFDTVLLHENPSETNAVEMPDNAVIAQISDEINANGIETDATGEPNNQVLVPSFDANELAMVERVVVVGAFSVEKNIENMFQLLTEAGYEAVKITVPGSRLTRVGAVKREVAGIDSDFLLELKQKINKDAWILAE